MADTDLLIVTLLIYGGMGSAGPLVFGLMAWKLLMGLRTPSLESMFNALIPCEQRATLLSFRSLVVQMGCAVALPLIGLLARHWGMGFTVAAVASILSLSALFYWRLHPLDLSIQGVTPHG